MSTTSDDDAPPPPQHSGVFTRTGSGGSRGAAPANAAFSDEMAQLMQAEQRLTRAVAEQTRLMQQFETRLAQEVPSGGSDKAVAALEARVLQVLGAMDKRLKAAEARAEAAEDAARRAAADSQALAAQLAELRAAAATRQHAPQHAQEQWNANPFFDSAPHSAPPAQHPAAGPASAAAGVSYAPTPYASASYGALPPAPHTAGSTRAQAAAAEQAAMDVINLINRPPPPQLPYTVGTDPSPAAARAAAALAQARARMRSREGGAAAPPAAAAAPFQDGLSSVSRARQLLDSIGAEGGARHAPHAPAPAPLAGLLAQAGSDDLT